MEALGPAASLGQLIEFTLKTIKYLNSIKDASKDRTRLLREAPCLLSLLVSLKTYIDEHQSETWSDGIQLLAVKDGPTDQLREALKQLTERLKAKKGLQGMARSMIWTLDKDYCEDLLLKIERAKSTIGLALHGDTLYAGPDSQDETHADVMSYSKLAQAIKADTAAIGCINRGVITVSESLERLHTQEDSKQRQKILEWFSPLNFSMTQQDLFKSREDGTGQWLIDSPTFKDWFSGEHHTLCCTGIPGAGKSILASVIVDFLGKVRTKATSTGVAAIYCEFKERQMQTSENLLAGACVQLAQQSSGPLPKALVDVHESHSKFRTRPNCAEVLKILDEVVHDFNTVYLVIDALDESSEQDRNILLKQTKALSGNIRLLVTTRHVDDIVNRFRNCPRIEIRATDADLTKYISSRVSTEKRLGRILQDHPPLENQLCKLVTAKADGMFLAAKFHMDALSSRGSLKSLRKALRTLPTTLDELYNDALHRIEAQSPEDRQLAFKALRWVAYTYRPLGFRALQEALAIEPGEEDFDRDGLYPTGLVVDVCAGLLAVDMDTGRVRLVHYTAQVFLDSILVSRFPDAHAIIAGDCLTYLSYKLLQSRRYLPNWYTRHPFLAYALTFWAAHARIKKTPKFITQMHEYLARTTGVYLITPTDYDQLQEQGRFLIAWGQCPSFGIAAFYGLCDELTHSLQQDVAIDGLIYFQDKFLQPRILEAALHLAARNDQVETACILLDHGADIENWNSIGNTPLIHAIQHKAMSTAKALIHRGANTMAEGSNAHIPFQMVCSSSPRPFLQDLLDAGAIIKRRHLFQASPLMYSIIDNVDLQTNEWVFEAALKDPDRTPVPSTMLKDAAAMGALYMVDALLDFGADVNTKDIFGGTALHGACQGHQPAVVERLLERGSNVNERNDQGETALHLAARLDHIGIVKSLISYKSENNIQALYGVSPLMKAIHSGGTSSALFLIQHGAATGITDINGIKALHLASARANVSLVRRLVNESTSVEQKSHLNLAAFFPAEEQSMQSYDASIALLDMKDYHGYRVAVFAAHGFKALNELRDEVEFSQIEKRCVSWRFWDQGMTAFDIALLRNDEQIIDVLTLRKSMGNQSYRKTREDYLSEGFATSTFQDLMGAFKRRSFKGHGLHKNRPTEPLLELWQMTSDWCRDIEIENADWWRDMEIGDSEDGFTEEDIVTRISSDAKASDQIDSEDSLLWS
ncbi:MAG: hypothetical protein Q9180_002691 [Flavoplaca navasiana]